MRRRAAAGAGGRRRGTGFAGVGLREPGDGGRGVREWLGDDAELGGGDIAHALDGADGSDQALAFVGFAHITVEVDGMVHGVEVDVAEAFSELAADLAVDLVHESVGVDVVLTA
jgi:hypothetical protein